MAVTIHRGSQVVTQKLAGARNINCGSIIIIQSQVVLERDVGFHQEEMPDVGDGE